MRPVQKWIAGACAAACWLTVASVPAWTQVPDEPEQTIGKQFLDGIKKTKQAVLDKINVGTKRIDATTFALRMLANPGNIRVWWAQRKLLEQKNRLSDAVTIGAGRRLSPSPMLNRFQRGGEPARSSDGRRPRFIEPPSPVVKPQGVLMRLGIDPKTYRRSSTPRSLLDRIRRKS